MHIETLSVHAGRAADPSTGAIATPIVLSTTFEHDPTAGDSGFSYGRYGNPNRAALERALAELEGGVDAAAFASGSAATMALLQSLAPGDHVLIPADRYRGTLLVLRDVLARWSLKHTVVDMTDPALVDAAMTDRTRLVWIETPSNPLLSVVDIARVAAVAHARGARCVVDNTFATPVLQRPFAHGADLVVHSTTKYISGHTDVLGGAVVTREQDDLWSRLRDVQMLGGTVPSPFECWLTLRSLATLPLRIRAHSASALEIAEFLASDARVSAVHYPGLASHPGHDIALRQMRAFGGVVSFHVAAGESAAIDVVRRTRLFAHATSLGGVESLIEHRASTEGPGSTAPRDLIRLSIGLEHPDDLRADLAQAFG